MNKLKSFSRNYALQFCDGFIQNVLERDIPSTAKVEKSPGKRTLSGVEPVGKAFLAKIESHSRIQGSLGKPAIFRIFEGTSCTNYGAMTSLLDLTALVGVSQALEA